MFTWLRSRLDRARTLPRSIVSPSMLAYLVENHQRSGIAQDIAGDPAMCLPQLPGKATAHVTRAIDTRIIGQDETLAWWDDGERTQTMETAIIEV